MALSLGTRLGPYGVTAPIGEGGMGKVVLLFNFFDELNRLLPVKK